MTLLNSLLDELKQQHRTSIPGEEAFKLYDTHGFPLELTQEVAAEHGFTVDVSGFEQSMQRQQERSRSATTFAQGKDEAALTDILKRVGPTEFTGYQDISGSGKVQEVGVDGFGVGDV